MGRVNKYALYALGLIVICLLLIFGLSRLRSKKDKPSVSLKEESVVIPEPIYRYGIAIDSFDIEDSEIGRNENLSTILLARGISYARIDELAKKSNPIFDVRKIKAGNPCSFFWKQDSVKHLAYFIYERNLEEFVIYEFLDTIKVTLGEKDVSTEVRTVSGEIKSSLWNSLADQNVSTKLAVELSDIYAWTIDFFGLQKGDRYRIIYSVKLIEGEAIGVDQVLSASFFHGGTEHYAIGFTQDNRFTYFDEKGQSLRRAFLKAPLNFRRISSRFTKSRYHPILKIYRPHSGIDYAADEGTEVQTIGDGKVVKVSFDKASGNYIKIKHNSVYTSGYMHLKYRPKFNVGDYVKQGQVIGYVGKTGYATGPHLDFRVWMNGQPIDPLKMKSPPVEPVAENLKTRFDSIVQQALINLNGIADRD